MKNQLTLGTSSVSFKNPVFIQSCASIVGQKEGEGPLGSCFDKVCEDPLFGTDTWEAAESTMQKETALLAIRKAGLQASDIRFLFAGDLLAQTVASSFGTADLGIPFYGLFGACSTMGESLSLGSLCVAGGYGKHILCATSSHFASAERQFRFPLAYGNQRPFSSTWTVTGCGSVLVGKRGLRDEKKSFRPMAQIAGITTGRIVDMEFRDSMNMGGAMAMAAVDTILQNFRDLDVEPGWYDKIITGDLGSVGQKILLDFLEQAGFDVRGVHMDCGMTIFDSASQYTHSGGSGCGCSAVTFCSYILPKIQDGTWKRILFLPTGALLSQISFNEGQSVPGIAHGVVIERAERR